MKNKSPFNFAIIFVIVLVSATSCVKEDTVIPAPKRIFIVTAVAPGTTTFTNKASGPKTSATVTARIYVNEPSDKDVVVDYTFSGSAVQGINYTPPTSSRVTIPAGSYFAPVILTIINNPSQTAPATVVINLVSASENYKPGLGTNNNYALYTYTILP